ncbi:MULTISPECIES: hypothetical protein [unclassified Vibrio]|uniref:KfrA N-terminal DNA-binding domain-containing protein n=1 Tax=Vibrio sp. HB236076 TaxID=3232307 RepID=A0AB39HCX6_9VIBR|nr:hypothetical protein [Vibrio sp. HB161653]MDP5254868.1 hypothetical protein [Vibrio sp. HB161653]
MDNSRDVTTELTQILTQLERENKTPSVALIKARLSQPVPMPALIATMKRWKQQKSVPKVEVQNQSDSDLASRVAELESEVTHLREKLLFLERQIKAK